MLVVAVDTGNRYIKTAHAEPFSAGLNRHFSSPPIIATDTLCYEGNYYSFSETQGYHRKDKSIDDYYFILSLAGIAREIAIKNEMKNTFDDSAISLKKVLREAEESGKVYNEEIYLCVGLPPRDMNNQYASFREYFLKTEPIKFTYNNVQFEVTIKDVFVFAQGFAAITPNKVFKEISKYPQANIIDIGGYTTDVGSVINGRISTDYYESLEYGAIHLYNRIIDAVGKEYSTNISVVHIEAILKGQKIGNEKIENMVKSIADSYAKELVAVLKDKGIDLDLSLPVLLGGGSLLLRQSLKDAINRKDIYTLDDIRANAKGYESMGIKKAKKIENVM